MYVISNNPVWVCACGGGGGGVGVIMVAAISGAALIDPQNPNKSTPQDQNPRKDNAFIASNNRRPISKQVPSRYMSPSTSATPRRCPPTPSSNNARSVSVDRRRPLPLRPDLNQKLVKNGTEMTAAAKLLVTSTRRLSVSFQGEAYSFPVCKTKAAPQHQSPNFGSVRKGTPERRTNTPVRGKVDSNGHHVENSKPIDQHRWPATIRQSNTLSRSFNYSGEDNKKLFGSDKVIRALQKSMVADESRRASSDGKLGLNLGSTERLNVRKVGLGGSSVNGSDSDSVSSASTSGAQGYGAIKLPSIAVSAKFKPIDQHRWPARIRQSNTLSRSLAYSAEDKKRWNGSDKVIRSSQQSMMADEGRRASFDGRLGVNVGNGELLKVTELGSLVYGSDSDSVSSGSTSGVQDCIAVKPRSIVVLANSKPIDQHRLPPKIRQSNTLWRSLDYSAKDKNSLVGSDKVIRACKQSMLADEGQMESFNGGLGFNLENSELLRVRESGPDGNFINGSNSDSICWDSTSGMQDSGAVKPRCITVSAKFWQETNSRLRRLHDSGSPLSPSPAKLVVPPKFGQSKKYLNDSVTSSPRSMPSPVRSGLRPSSPSKLMHSIVSSPSRGMASPSRGMTSPSRVRNSLINFNEMPSVLSFPVDVRRGKVGENQLVDAHSLRLLYNRQLQWRFVNAKAESALLLQKRRSEKNLWNAWITISELRDLVTRKQHRLQLLRKKLKLSSILKGQITFLEDWASFEKDHFVSLVGAVEVLRASTLRLPVVGGATADVQNVKEVIGSAVDMMQAMASSLRLLSSKAEEMKSLVAELEKVTTKESALLEQCKGFFSILASMQVKTCSLRTHILQRICARQPDNTKCSELI